MARSRGSSRAFASSSADHGAFAPHFRLVLGNDRRRLLLDRWQVSGVFNGRHVADARNILVELGPLGLGRLGDKGWLWCWGVVLLPLDPQQIAEKQQCDE